MKVSDLLEALRSADPEQEVCIEVRDPDARYAVAFDTAQVEHGGQMMLAVTRL